MDRNGGMSISTTSDGFWPTTTGDVSKLVQIGCRVWHGICWSWERKTMGMKPKPKKIRRIAYICGQPTRNWTYAYCTCRNWVTLPEVHFGPWKSWLRNYIVATTSTSAGYRSPNSWRVPKKHRSEHPFLLAWIGSCVWHQNYKTISDWFQLLWKILVSWDYWKI